TALPETALPFVAILTGHATGNDVGVGAILGGPFMLCTLGMCLLGASVLRFARSRRRPPVLQAEPSVIGQDLGYFSVAFALGIPVPLSVAPAAHGPAELMNGVRGIRRRQDTLAAGNVTRAMVFQATFPMIIGLLGTSWRPSGVALAAALRTLRASTMVGRVPQ